MKFVGKTSLVVIKVSILGAQVSGITEKTGLTGKDEISLGPKEFEVSMGHS